MSQIRELNNDSFRNGFASMALCCLQIDTFYQFEHGCKKTTNNHNCYVAFLTEQLGDVFDTQEKADRFYIDIRCEILHSAQACRDSRLSNNGDAMVSVVDALLLKEAVDSSREYNSVRSTFPFCFTDYNDPSKARNGYWNLINMKGMLSFNRNRKKSFYALQNAYRKCNR